MGRSGTTTYVGGGGGASREACDCGTSLPASCINLRGSLSSAAWLPTHMPQTLVRVDAAEALQQGGQHCR